MRDLELGIEVGLHQVDVAEQLAETLEGVVLALDRNDHLAGGGQTVDGQQTERRRAVDQDEVEIVARPARGPASAAAPD